MKSNSRSFLYAVAIIVSVVMTAYAITQRDWASAISFFFLAGYSVLAAYDVGKLIDWGNENATQSKNFNSEKFGGKLHLGPIINMSDIASGKASASLVNWRGLFVVIGVAKTKICTAKRLSGSGSDVIVFYDSKGDVFASTIDNFMPIVREVKGEILERRRVLPKADASMHSYYINSSGDVNFHSSISMVYNSDERQVAFFDQDKNLILAAGVNSDKNLITTMHDMLYEDQAYHRTIENS